VHYKTPRELVKISPDTDPGGVDTTQHTVVGFQFVRTVMRITQCTLSRKVVGRERPCGDENISTTGE
jgi:predicted ATPase